MAISRPKVTKPMNRPKVGGPKVKPVPPASIVKEEPKLMDQPPIEEVVEEQAIEPIEPPKVEETIEEPVVMADEPTIEEIIEETQTEEPKQEEKPIEEKPKAKKKSTKKNTKKKETATEEQPIEEVNENLPNMNLKDAMNTMSDELNIEEEGWDEIKQEIIDKLKTTVIDPDISPTDMRYLAAEIDSILTDLKIYKVDVENRTKALTERMEYIRVSNAVGTNTESRKASGYEALFNYKKDPSSTESINLIQIKLVLEGQLNFYNSAIETLMSRKSLLVTFLGVVKLEASI